MKKELIYSAIALNHIARNADKKADFNKVIASSWLTVDKLLSMTWEEFVKTNANEVMNTTETGFGGDWVEKSVIIPEILQRAKDSKSLLAYIKSWYPDANDIIFPVQWKRTRMIVLEENKDQPQNKTLTSQQVKRLATPIITIHSKEFIITIYVSDKLMRQAVVNIANYVLDEIYVAYENTAHQIILNGDVATADNTNINIIDWDVDNLPWGAKSDLLAFDGARKTAITNGSTINALANLDLSVIRQARAKMGIKGINPTNLKLVVSQGTYFALLGLTQVETIEKFGASATVTNWVLSAIDWIEIISREELGLTLANWTISEDTGDNVYDQAVLIHTPSMLFWTTYWLVLEESRYAEEKTTGYTGSVGLAAWWDNEQNNDQPTSPCVLIHNIAINGVS